MEFSNFPNSQFSKLIMKTQITSYWKMIFTRLLHNPTTVIGGILVVLFLLTALLAPFLSPHDPTEQNLMENLNKPSSAHILGQDDIGRDVLSRIIDTLRFYNTKIHVEFMGDNPIPDPLLIDSIIGYYLKTTIVNS